MNNDPTSSPSLWQFLIDLATNPQLQATMSTLAHAELSDFLTKAGLSMNEAQLLINAQDNSIGRQQLIEHLGANGPWHIHGPTSATLDTDNGPWSVGAPTDPNSENGADEASSTPGEG